MCKKSELIQGIESAKSNIKVCESEIKTLTKMAELASGLRLETLEDLVIYGDMFKKHIPKLEQKIETLKSNMEHYKKKIKIAEQIEKLEKQLEEEETAVLETGKIEVEGN